MFRCLCVGFWLGKFGFVVVIWLWYSAGSSWVIYLDCLARVALGLACGLVDCACGLDCWLLVIVVWWFGILGLLLAGWWLFVDLSSYC